MTLEMCTMYAHFHLQFSCSFVHSTWCSVENVKRIERTSLALLKMLEKYFLRVICAVFFCLLLVLFMGWIEFIIVLMQLGLWFLNQKEQCINWNDCRRQSNLSLDGIRTEQTSSLMESNYFHICCNECFQFKWNSLMNNLRKSSSIASKLKEKMLTYE